MVHANYGELSLQIGLRRCVGHNVGDFHARWTLVKDLVVLEWKPHGEFAVCNETQLDSIATDWAATVTWSIRVHQV